MPEPITVAVAGAGAKGASAAGGVSGAGVGAGGAAAGGAPASAASPSLSLNGGMNLRALGTPFDLQSLQTAANQLYSDPRVHGHSTLPEPLRQPSGAKGLPDSDSLLLHQREHFRLQHEAAPRKVEPPSTSPARPADTSATRGESPTPEARRASPEPQTTPEPLPGSRADPEGAADSMQLSDADVAPEGATPVERMNRAGTEEAAADADWWETWWETPPSPADRLERLAPDGAHAAPAPSELDRGDRLQRSVRFQQPAGQDAFGERFPSLGSDFSDDDKKQARLIYDSAVWLGIIGPEDKVEFHVGGGVEVSASLGVGKFKLRGYRQLDTQGNSQERLEATAEKGPYNIKVRRDKNTVTGEGRNLAIFDLGAKSGKVGIDTALTDRAIGSSIDEVAADIVRNARLRFDLNVHRATKLEVRARILPPSKYWIRLTHSPGTGAYGRVGMTITKPVPTYAIPERTRQTGIMKGSGIKGY